MLTTLGDAISTYAASIAIEESIENSILQNQSDKELEERLKRIEQQLESLQNEF